MTKTVVRASLLATVVVALVTTSGWGSECLRRAGRFPYGPTWAVAAAGSYAYFGSGATLVAADVSGPDAPVVVGAVSLIGVAEEIAIAGDLVVVATGEAGLQLVDVARPSAPRVVGEWSWPGHEVSQVAAAGSHAYVLQSRLVMILDISVAASPSPSAAVEVAVEAGEHNLDVAAAGTSLFVLTGKSVGDDGYRLTLRVLDVADPAAVHELGSMSMVTTLGRSANRVVAKGDCALLTDEVGLRVVDVSDPRQPRLAATLERGSVYAASLGGPYAYVGAGGRVEVIDVTVPSQPFEVGSRAVEGGIRALAAWDQRVVVASGRGISVIDAGSPTAPQEVGRVSLPGRFGRVALHGSHAYLADFPWGLRVFDLSDHRRPRDAGLVELRNAFDEPFDGTDADSWELATMGDHLYVSALPFLVVLDLTDPERPLQEGSTFLTATIDATRGDVAVGDGYAYVTADGNGVVVVDVSDPSHPFEAGVVAGFGAYSIVVAGDHAYVGGGGNGLELRVLSLSDPAAPATVGTYPVRCDDWLCIAPYVSAVAGGYAYVVTADHGLQIVDVTNPALPTFAGEVDLEVIDLAVSGSDAVAVTAGGVHLIDVSDPAAPVVAASFQMAATAVAFGGRTVCVVEDGTGLTVMEPLEFCGPATGEPARDAHER